MYMYCECESYIFGELHHWHWSFNRSDGHICGYNLTTTGWDCRASIWNLFVWIQPTDWKGELKRWWAEVWIQISVKSSGIDFQHKHVINSLHNANGFSLWFTWKWDSLVEILSLLACQDLLATTVYTTHVFYFLLIHCI